jgi:hypothetical protein
VVGPQRAAIEARERAGAARDASTVTQPEPAIGSPANVPSGSLATAPG